MPDTLLRRDTEGLSAADLIRRERRPLPAHDLDGVNYRAWAAAVCDAEFAHRSRDFARVEVLLGLSIDYHAYPTCVEWGQFRHEAYACAGLNWLSHLQAHERERRAPWDCLPWDMWSAKRRKDWLTRRRYLWAGFLKAVRAYQAERAKLDAPAFARAA